MSEFGAALARTSSLGDERGAVASHDSGKATARGGSPRAGLIGASAWASLRPGHSGKDRSIVSLVTVVHGAKKNVRLYFLLRHLAPFEGGFE